MGKHGKLVKLMNCKSKLVGNSAKGVCYPEYLSLLRMLESVIQSIATTISQGQSAKQT